MTYTQHYDSPLGGILLAADEEGLTGLWFDGQKYFARTLPKEYAESETPVLCEAKRWLDIYFSGREPDFTPQLHPAGSAFQQAVWALLLEIPYGKTTTYGALARKLAEKQGLTHMSAQAVGGAVGAQRYFAYHPLPPRGRRERQPDRLRGRRRQKDQAARA